MSNRRIVVGVDGSDAGRRALQWAVHEADERGAVVQAVIAWRWDLAEFPARAADPMAEGQGGAERTLMDQLAALPGQHRTTISAEVVEGRPADVLSAAAQGADLLVIGSHGHSRVWTTVLGSVAEECVLKASCPVVVIPVEQPHVGPNSVVAIPA